MLWMLGSASFLSLSFLAVKLSSVEVSFFLLVFGRFFISFVLYALYLACRLKLRATLPTSNLRFHLARGFTVTAGMYCLYYYITISDLLYATLFLNIAPMLIPLIERIFLKYPLGKSTVLALLVSFAGVLFIIRPTGEIFNWAILIGLSAAIFWATGQTIFGLNVHREALETSVFYFFLMGSAFSFPALFFVPLHLENFGPTIAFLIFAMGLFTLFNQYMRGLAYTHGKPSTMATFIYFSILLSALFDWLFFHIIPTTLTLIGALLIILGGVLKVALRHYILKRKHQK